MLALALVIIGVLFRFIPHLSNFSPLMAIALFGGVYLNKRYALVLPLALMGLTDIVLGIHNVALFNYAAILIIAMIGMKVRERKNARTVMTGSLASASIFFVVSNFGVWLMGWYPPTMNGLVTCYTVAIPFFRMTLASTVVFSVVFFGAYELIARRVSDTRLAKVFLTS